jgi:hypothetical protein
METMSDLLFASEEVGRLCVKSKITTNRPFKSLVIGPPSSLTVRFEAFQRVSAINPIARKRNGPIKSMKGLKGPRSSHTERTREERERDFVEMTLTVSFIFECQSNNDPFRRQTDRNESPSLFDAPL